MPNKLVGGYLDVGLQRPGFNNMRDRVEVSDAKYYYPYRTFMML